MSWRGDCLLDRLQNQLIYDNRENSMAGITSFGAYIPFYRLAHKEIARAWGGRAGEGERAVANVDEDSITMAVEAVRDLLAQGDGREVDGLMFATTTSPYSEKQASALIATAADLRNDVRTADYTSSLRSATTATLAALDSVNMTGATEIRQRANVRRRGFGDRRRKRQGDCGSDRHSFDRR